MSYEIVKGIKIDEAAGKVFIKASSNNVIPKHFDWWEAPVISEILHQKGKEEVEKVILLEYWEGNLQGGDNLYDKTVRYYKHRLPYKWNNTGKAEERGKTNRFGYLIEFTTEEVKEGLYQKYLAYKQRDMSARFCISWKDMYIRKRAGRHLYLAWDQKSAKHFNSYEDAFVYALNFTQNPEELIERVINS